MKRLPILPILGATFLPMLLASCGAGFQKAWNSAAVPGVGHPLAGRWDGQWKSDGNGHEGSLKCVVSTVPNRPTALDFHYYARWGRIFAAPFQHQATATPAGANKWRINGSKDLGAQFGGTFTHQGEATPQALETNYQAMGDHGKLLLHRPEK